MCASNALLATARLRCYFVRETVRKTLTFTQFRFCSHPPSQTLNSLGHSPSVLHGAAFALAGSICTLLATHFVNRQTHREARNYQKVLQYSKFPKNSHVEYYIERRAKRAELVQHIKLNAIRGKRCVVNVIVEKGKGKTTLLKSALEDLHNDETMKQDSQIYYVDAANGIKSFLEDEYCLKGYESEEAAVGQLFLNLQRMQQQQRKQENKLKRLCIIVDSPDGMQEVRAMERFVRRSKSMVDNGTASVYMVTSSPPGDNPNAATTQLRALCKRILGVFERTGRYKEFEDDAWINLDLSAEEKEELLAKVEETEKYRLDAKARVKFVNRCSQITNIGAYGYLAGQEVIRAKHKSNN